MDDGSLLRSGSETWGPVSPDNVHETGVSPNTVPIPHRGRGGRAGRANSKKDLVTGPIRGSCALQGDQDGPAESAPSARRPGFHLASCDDEAGIPTRRSAAGWRLDLLGVHASTCKQPRDQRVGVPHVAGVQLGSAPNRGWDGRHKIKDSLGASEVVRDADRARDRLVRIGDRPPRHRRIS
jgi:hypothetical protein